MPKRKNFEDFWEEFETQCAITGLVSKVPTMMKKLLTACGYNHAWAFKEVDNEKVTQLETFIETRHRKIVDSFDEYREIKPFEFLPGHRDLIFAIKTEILSFDNSKKTKAKDLPARVPNENELKQNLINQVSSYSSSLALELDWGNAIQKFETKTDGDSTFAECSLSCPLCNAVRIIRYDSKYWTISNMNTHLRTHMQQNQASNKKSSNRSTKRPTKTPNKKIKSGSKHRDGAMPTEFLEEIELENVQDVGQDVLVGQENTIESDWINNVIVHSDNDSNDAADAEDYYYQSNSDSESFYTSLE